MRKLYLTPINPDPQKGYQGVRAAIVVTPKVRASTPSRGIKGSR